MSPTREASWKKPQPEDYVPESDLDDGTYIKDKSPAARWHRWKTDRFDLMAHTYAGKVDYIQIAPLAGVHVFLPQEEEAIGKSLGVPMSEDENGRFQGEGNGLFVHFVHNTVEIGTDQYLTRAIQ